MDYEDEYNRWGFRKKKKPKVRKPTSDAKFVSFVLLGGRLFGRKGKPTKSTSPARTVAIKKHLTNNDQQWYTGWWKGKLMSKVKKESVKQSKNLFHEAKLIVVGISNLAFVVAESVAAYVLWFSGQTIALKVVAGTLVLDASIRACKHFVKK